MKVLLTSCKPETDNIRNKFIDILYESVGSQGNFYSHRLILLSKGDSYGLRSSSSSQRIQSA